MSWLKEGIIIIAITSVLFNRLQNLAYATAYAVIWVRFLVCSKIRQLESDLEIFILLSSSYWGEVFRWCYLQLSNLSRVPKDHLRKKQETCQKESIFTIVCNIAHEECIILLLFSTDNALLISKLTSKSLFFHSFPVIGLLPQHSFEMREDFKSSDTYMHWLCNLPVWRYLHPWKQILAALLSKKKALAFRTAMILSFLSIRKDKPISRQTKVCIVVYPILSCCCGKSTEWLKHKALVFPY